MRTLWMLLIAFSANDLDAQTVGEILEHNTRLVQAAKTDPQYGCPNPRSSKSISKAARRYDRNIIGFLNQFYNEERSSSQIRIRADKLFRQNSWTTETSDTGIIYKAHLAVRGNLDVRIVFTEISEKVINKRIELITVSRTKCDTDYNWVLPLDIVFIEQNVLGQLAFPLKLVYLDGPIVVEK